MPPLTHDERTAFLRERGILLRLAVARRDGRPLVTPIWYVYEEDAIYFTPRERSEWFQCLREDPRVALCIDEASLPYRKVTIEGVAVLIHDVGSDDEWRDQYRRMACRYVPEEGAEAYVRNTINERRGLFRVVLAGSRVRSWRMPLADEPPEGIWHARYYRDPAIKFET